MIYDLSYGKWGSLIFLTLQNIVTYQSPSLTQGKVCLNVSIPNSHHLKLHLTRTFTHSPSSIRNLQPLEVINWVWMLDSNSYSTVAITEYGPEALLHMVIKEPHLIASYCRIKRARVLHLVAECSPWNIPENPRWN